MKKGILTSLILLLVSNFGLAGNGNTYPGFGAPIDTYQIVLIVAAVLLTVGAIAYKKLSLKKA